MKKLVSVLVIILCVISVGACANTDITENVGIKTGTYYSDSVEKSTGNNWNYSKQIIAEGLTTPLDLSNGQLDELVLSWKSTVGSGKLSEIVLSEDIIEKKDSIEIVPMYTNNVGFGETIDSIVVYNLSDTDLSVKSCVENGWFSVVLANYEKCFNLSESKDKTLFQKISDSLGNPTQIFEEYVSEEEYVKGIRLQHVVFEFPDYTIVGNIREDGKSLELLGMSYINKTLWKQEVIGLKMYYSSIYMEREWGN